MTKVSFLRALCGQDPDQMSFHKLVYREDCCVIKLDPKLYKTVKTQLIDNQSGAF